MINLQLLKENFDRNMSNTSEQSGNETPEGGRTYEPEVIAQLVVDKLAGRKAQSEDELLDMIRDAWIEQYSHASTQHISGLKRQYQRKITIDDDFLPDTIMAIKALQSPHSPEPTTTQGTNEIQSLKLTEILKRNK